MVEADDVAGVAGDVAAGAQAAVLASRPARRRDLRRCRRARRCVAPPWRRERRVARPFSVPSAPSVMRSCGRAGAIVIACAGEEIPARASSQPASSVSASGTASAKRPAAPSTAKPSSMPAPEPPRSSGTQASGRPASSIARHSGAVQPSSFARLTVCGSARSAKIRAAVAATMLSLAPATFACLPGFRRHSSCCDDMVGPSVANGKAPRNREFAALRPHLCG